MKTILITEGQYSRLLEYHHAYDNVLEQDARNIVNAACKAWSKNGGMDWFDSRYGDKVFLFSYDIESLGSTIGVNVWRANDCAYDAYSRSVLIGSYYLDDAVNGDGYKHLLQLVYHELGHMTNVIKSDSVISQTKVDFNKPLWLSMSEDDYKEISRNIYMFYTRELKARCFESTMFMREHPNATIQDLYNDRCSNITKMRKFIAELNQLRDMEGNEAAKDIMIGLCSQMKGKLRLSNTKGV